VGEFMKNDQYIVGIESSCDETAVAIIKNGREIVANVVASQIESHKRFGGVVPEIASRHHVEQITIVIEEAMNQANLRFSEIDAIAVTEGPGLVGALLIGVNAAKALAFAHHLPLVPVHHIAGHIYANRLVTEMKFPLLALVVSGGHTELVYMKEHGHFEVIGETRDDAAGEAYDKVARTLNLPYPGGPHIDRLAQAGSPTIDLPRAWLEGGSYDFSFSGLKSAVINTVHNAEQRGETIAPEDLAASFQASVIEVLVKKTENAVSEYGVGQVLVAGGVAANKGLRAALEKAFSENAGVELVIPPISLCTDNAAMIAAAGSIMFEKGIRAELSLNANPGLEIEIYNQ
jgi:N6-L-threonylcarbamoyladenine synthase